MALLPSTLIAYTIVTLYTLAGQAHFTASMTPSLAATVEQMTPNAHAVFSAPLGLSYQTTKHVFGVFDLGAAALMLRRRTRKAGLTAAVVGFAGGWYGQVAAGAEQGMTSMFLALAVLGRVLAGFGW